MQKVDLPSGLRRAQSIVEARSDSAGGRPSSQGSSQGGNSGVMVEEDKPTWLQDWAEGRGRHLTAWLRTEGLTPPPRGERSESRRGSHVSFEVGSEDENDEGGRREDTHQ